MKYGTLCPGVPLLELRLHALSQCDATEQAKSTRMALYGLYPVQGTEPRGQLEI